VWLVSPRAVRIGGVLIATPEIAAAPDVLRLRDSNAFGTGHHPTTALCIEALEEILAVEHIAGVLDVGAGTGILALAALRMGVPQAVGLDIDDDALRAAAENARLNNLEDRLQLVHGGPDSVSSLWPLVVANVLAAPLIEMAPLIVRRVESRGLLILSGIPCSVESEVRKAYEHLGMRHVDSKARAGWVMLMARASW
jgi:ribosomal protein L11 methyltransferase